MRRRIFTEEEKNIIYQAYFVNRQGLRPTAALVHAGETTLLKLFKEMGWHARNVQEANSLHFSEQEQKDIIHNYTQNNIGTFSLAKKYKCSEKAIATVLKHAGVHIRNYTEAKQAGRKYKVNDDYFKTQSHNMAYILGLLAADGYVAVDENKIALQLRSYDAEILFKIQAELQSERPVKIYTDSKGIEYAKLSIWSKTLKDDLAVYNIVPQKTFKLRPPVFLDKQYWISFIRGYFDGDGSIFISGNNVPGFSIIGASKEMITWIRETLVNMYGVHNNKIYTEQSQNGTIIYKTVYYGNTCQQIYNILYKDSSSLFLKRKYDKFTLLLNNPRDFSSSDIEE